jgi:kynurenine formamidase
MDGRETNWGRWGTEDERGALNLLTESEVLGGVSAVRRGRVYGLGLPIDETAAPVLKYRGAPRRLTLTSDSDQNMYVSMGAAPGVGGNQEILMIPSHHGTHIDALSHVYVDNAMYNGFPSSSFKSFSGAAHLGAEKLGVIAGRGVLLDVARHAGLPVLPAGHAVTGEELASCAAAQGTEVRPGDILLVRTGWLESWSADRDAPRSGQPGLGLSAVEFVRDHDISVVGADNSAVEVMPFEGGIFLRIHIELLVKAGVPLIELAYLAELARDGVHEFLFVAAPLPVRGAAGSPLNPVAIA